MPAINRKKLISYMLGYFWTERTIETIHPNEIHNFTSLANLEKDRDMGRIPSVSPDIIGQRVFSSSYLKPTTLLHVQASEKIDLLEARLAYLFVPKYYQDKCNEGFMNNLKYLRKVFANRNDHVSKRVSEFDRVLNIYVSTTVRAFVLSESEINWNFPDKYSKTLGLSVRRFSFNFPDVSDSLKTLFEPSPDLIEKETGTEEISSVPTQYSIIRCYKKIK